MEADFDELVRLLVLGNSELLKRTNQMEEKQMSKFSRFNHMHEGVPFMNGRSLAKVTTLVGNVIHITDFAFLNRVDPETGEVKRYAVFIIAENRNNFFFGSQGINEVLASLSAEEKAELASVPVTVKQGTAVKSGNTFTYLEFPED